MRQVARRRVQEALAIKQKDREAKERRLQSSAVAEQTAAMSVAAMVAEGLSLAEFADWCGGLDVREVTRLSRIAPKAVTP